MTGFVGGVDSFLKLAFVDHGHQTAIFFGFEEKFPGLIGKGSGEVFNVVGTAGGVNDLVEMRFFLQQQLLVAGNALREIGGLLVGGIERSNSDGVDAGDGGTHALSLAAQHVDIGIKNGLVVQRSMGVDDHLGGTAADSVIFVLATGAGGLVGCYELGPQHTGGAEFGDFHEVVRTDGEVEHNLLGDVSGGQTGFGQGAHVFVTPSQCITEFLIAIGT